MAKTRIVIRNMDDVIDFQVLRWKKAFPAAAEPEEWSPNEIKPDEHYRPTEEVSEEDVAVILEDDARWVGSVAGSGFVRRGTYSKGIYRADNDMAARNAQAEIDRLAHYDRDLAGVLNDLQRDYGEEYEIVYDGQNKNIAENDDIL